jgi:hypothetical protein
LLSHLSRLIHSGLLRCVRFVAVLAHGAAPAQVVEAERRPRVCSAKQMGPRRRTIFECTLQNSWKNWAGSCAIWIASQGPPRRLDPHPSIPSFSFRLALADLFLTKEEVNLWWLTFAGRVCELCALAASISPPSPISLELPFALSSAERPQDGGPRDAS